MTTYLPGLRALIYKDFSNQLGAPLHSTSPILSNREQQKLIMRTSCLCLSLVRVHVRRTDKVGTEAAFHPIEEYMVHVEEQFQLLARRVHVDKKRVYLATDDPSLLQEAKTK